MKRTQSFLKGYVTLYQSLTLADDSTEDLARNEFFEIENSKLLLYSDELELLFERKESLPVSYQKLG